MKTIDLGWCVARLDQANHQLTILSRADISPHDYPPPESVVVCGEANVLALRDALNEVYPSTKPKGAV